MSELKWPPRGNFGYKALVGPHEYEPERLIETRGYFRFGLGRCTALRHAA